MTTKSPSKRNKKPDPVEETVSSFFQELKLAAMWHRPSILIAAYRSKLNLYDAQFWLEKKLRRNKQTVVLYKVTGENFDIPLILSEIPEKQNKVFFVTGLSQGGGVMGLNAYRALNFRRELLVDHRLRVVFWLDESEANMLPTHALDFWAFRHRMVEMFNEPTPRRIEALVKSLNWDRWNLNEITKELPTGLVFREELLAEIPDWTQAPAIRAELILMLAGFRWAKRDFREALNLLKKGFEILQNQNLASLQPRYWNGTGLVCSSSGNPEDAIKSFHKAIKLDPEYADAWNNLGKVYRDTGQFQAALEAVNNSISKDSKIAESWTNLGDLQNDLGQHEGALQSYKKALSINKKDAPTWIKLGDTYRLMGRPADSLPSFTNAKLIDANDSDLWLKMGLAYRDVGLINNAVRALYKAARLNPPGAIPWKKLGDIYRANNNLKYARKAYKTAASLDPQDKTVRYSLDACYARKRK